MQPSIKQIRFAYDLEEILMAKYFSEVKHDRIFPFNEKLP
jgi:hypothetical protein